MNDRWMERLSEYLDDELTPIEKAAIESHLETCRDCSAVLGDLRRVVDRARHLDDRVPGQDLWPGLAKRIGATPARPRVIGRKWSFSVPQLAAAAVALMTLSGGTVWLIQSPGSTAGNVPLAAVDSPAVTPVAVNAGHNAAQSYAAAVADLERV
ncbi:MAG TPA: zf-HC2 domain-containing protein, partial [Gemmatimonadales bacterium]|nr:zf-HC2 domain-containing protein [Gemmatimonadales bacterium]